VDLVRDHVPAGHPRRRPGPWFIVPVDLESDPRVLELMAGLSHLQGDSALLGYILLNAAAKRRNSGEFVTDLQLRTMLGRHARWIDRYREVGLLEGLAIADWAEWQQDRPADPTGAERQRRWRERRRSGVAVEQLVTRYVTPRGDGDNIRMESDPPLSTGARTPVSQAEAGNVHPTTKVAARNRPVPFKGRSIAGPMLAAGLDPDRVGFDPSPGPRARARPSG
jgi:hypothetical protein